MQRIKKVVEEKRAKFDSCYREMVEDYIVKAAEVLDRYLETSEGLERIFGHSIYSVEITDIDYETKTVEVGRVLVCDKNVCDENDNYVEEYYFSGWLFKNKKIHMNALESFISMLKGAGAFEVFVRVDKTGRDYNGLFPAIKFKA